jgi:esterase FrsA
VSFTFEADPQALIRERTEQFVGQGISRDCIRDVARHIVNLWEEEPGGWPYEWSVAARVEETAHHYLLASLLYGIAKYPCLGNHAHRTAYRKQLELYLLASGEFAQPFERRPLTVPYRGQMTKVPVHLFFAKETKEKAPVVLLLGGVDTWKMDIHNSAIFLSKMMDAHVALVDMSGVGESEVPSAPDAEVILSTVADQLLPIGNGRVGILGFSFGGLWAVKLALIGRIDAAAAVGAPVSASFEPKNLSRLPNGMAGIIGNSLFKDAPFASADSFAKTMGAFSLRSQGLYDWRLSPTPLLVANGSNDPYVAHADVLDFSNRPNTVTRLIPNATHCASEKSAKLMPWIANWLTKHLC